MIASCAAVVLFSTLFFRFAGIQNWRILAVAWALIPFVNTFLFMFVPIRTLEEEKGKGRFGNMKNSKTCRSCNGANVGKNH